MSADRNNNGTQKAILAGACLWGMQNLIRKRPGVLFPMLREMPGRTRDVHQR